jgi:hypothetical protein
MHLNQDPKIRNGKKKITHFGTRCLKITTKIKSLNDLQDCWKHNGGKKNDVAKFCGCYMVVVAMNEFESSQNDTLLKAMELYKLKHPKHMSFTFISCWWVFKDVPKWANMCDNLKKLVPLKRLTFPSDINEQLCEVCASSIEKQL